VEPDGGERPDTNCKPVESKRGENVEKISLPLSPEGWLPDILNAASDLDVPVSLPATLVCWFDAVAVSAAGAGRDIVSICAPLCSEVVTGANSTIWLQMHDESARLPISRTVRKRQLNRCATLR
jgi:hypothetical protein